MAYDLAPFQQMHPFMAAMAHTQTGHPTLGRRYMGLGASSFYPGGPVPVHQMNRLARGMLHHGMTSSPFGAGEYPFPRRPFPLGLGDNYNPVMGPRWSAPGGGGFIPPSYGASMPGFSSVWSDSVPSSSSGSSSLRGMSGLGGMSNLGSTGNMSDFSNGLWTSPYALGMGHFMPGGLPRFDDDDDDDDEEEDGTWDPDPDEDEPFAAYLRAVKKGRKKKSNSRSCINTMFGVPPMGFGMCMPPGYM